MQVAGLQVSGLAAKAAFSMKQRVGDRDGVWMETLSPILPAQFYYLNLPT